MPGQLPPTAHLPLFAGTSSSPAPPFAVPHHAPPVPQSVRAVSSANSSPIPPAAPAFAKPPSGEGPSSATSSATSTPAAETSAPSSVPSVEMPSSEARKTSAEEPPVGRTSPPTANGHGVSPANGDGRHDAPNLFSNNHPPQTQHYPSHQHPPQHHPPPMHFQQQQMAPMMGGGYQSLGGMHGGMGGQSMHGGMMPYLQQQVSPQPCLHACLRSGADPNFASKQQRSTSTPVPPGYSNRHLFVGNVRGPSLLTETCKADSLNAASLQLPVAGAKGPYAVRGRSSSRRFVNVGLHQSHLSLTPPSSNRYCARS